MLKKENLADGLDFRLHVNEERINELENISERNIQDPVQRKNEIEIKLDWKIWMDRIKDFHINPIRVLEKRIDKMEALQIWGENDKEFPRIDEIHEFTGKGNQYIISKITKKKFTI